MVWSEGPGGAEVREEEDQTIAGALILRVRLSNGKTGLFITAPCSA